MTTLIELATQLVAVQASKVPMHLDDMLAEINKVHAALKKLESGETVESSEEAKPTLSVKEAFKKNEIICMICGKGGFKTLSRHLSTAHDMKPGAYKKQFGIKSTQSLSAKSYSESRRTMALDRGLADNLAKAREVRMANIEAKKGAPVKAAKAAKVAKKPATVKAAPVPAKVKAAPKAKK
jgi:predicted transcriptional regulator